MSCWALVPVKMRTAGKRRLERVLSAEARAALVRAMLEHVLAVLGRCPAVTGIAVLSPDRDTVPAAVEVLPDGGQGMNTEIAAALAVLEQRGATQVAVIAADLPWLTVEDVGCLIGAAAAGSVAFAPDRHGTGTNALALRLPARFAFQFGAGSLARHRAAAAALGLETVNVERTGLAFDVDEPEDVTLLRERAAAGYAFLS